MPGRFADVVNNKCELGGVDWGKVVLTVAPAHIGDTGVVSAVLHGTAAEVEAALLCGDDADATDDNGVPILHLSAARGVIGIVMQVVRLGATVDKRNTRHAHRTALHTAAMLNKQAVAMYLVLSGAEVNALDDHGMTALHVAAQHSFKTLCIYLLEKGADPGLRDHSGRTAAEYLSSSGHLPLHNVNITGDCISDHELGALWTQHAGPKGIEAEAFRKLWASMDTMGAPLPKLKLEEGQEYVSYNEFCICMLRLAKI